MWDVAVIGGGALGCSTALHLARDGLKVVLFEAGALCQEASGKNAGTLSMQIKPGFLVPYSMKALALWQSAAEWLGPEPALRRRGSLVVAFNDEEAETVKTRMAERRDNGAPIEFVGANRAREIEPGLSGHVSFASHCAVDGYVDSFLLGRAYKRALPALGVEVRERHRVTEIERRGAHFALRSAGDWTLAGRVLLAAGAWLPACAEQFGLKIPMRSRPNQLGVTQRMRPLFRSIIGAATGILTLKQSDYGSVIIGGGWEGTGTLDDPDGSIRYSVPNMIGNIQVAHHAIPALAGAHLVRSWIGFEAETSDERPLAGPLPGIDGAYIIGCSRSGFTISPYWGRLMADVMQDREPELPMFDPARLITAA